MANRFSKSSEKVVKTFTKIPAFPINESCTGRKSLDSTVHTQLVCRPPSGTNQAQHIINLCNFHVFRWAALSRFIEVKNSRKRILFNFIKVLELNLN